MFKRLHVVLLALLAIGGCVGYQAHNGVPVYKTWDEGFGGREWAIPGVDPGTFVALNKHYSKDRNQVYFEAKVIQDADPSTFIVLSDQYAKDARHAYFEDRVVVDANSSSFRISKYDFAQDAADIFLHTTPLEVCDINTFRWLSDNWEMDSKCAYTRGRKLESADPATFKAINYWYAKDNNRVFESIFAKSIEGADSESFELDKGICEVCAHDKNRCYRYEKVVPCDTQK